MTQKTQLLKQLKCWTTGLDALKTCGTMKLSTRVGELRMAGYTIIDRWVDANGKRFKSYRLVK